ncbi:MAG: methyltransferase domain-containing protein [Candidatus Hydrogenedentota bacterium]|nr:MAG: methyltransferase domain-containing protein [Candidatus Hydrogenedentota bacterium]
MKVFERRESAHVNVIELAWNYYAGFYDVVQPFFLRLLGAFGDLSYDEFEEKFVKLAHVEPGQTVLDVACGTGASHPALSRAVGPKGKIVAVDISAEMLRRAKSRAQRLRLGKIGYHKADARKLSHHFKKESFDAVLCCNGLPHFLYPQPVLAEMTRVLRAGGTLALSTVNRDKCDDNPIWRWSMRYPKGRFPYKREYREILKKLGIVSLKFHEQGLMLIVTAKKRAGGKSETKRASVGSRGDATRSRKTSRRRARGL